ncbi:hypothetical protein EDC01DRAFT_746880 [Geopyxis carbonaria]|nr:hypothetical protein EDC01DRAFT_746880 [Geopyxis carbonaria]
MATTQDPRHTPHAPPQSRTPPPAYITPIQNPVCGSLRRTQNFSRPSPLAPHLPPHRRRRNEASTLAQPGAPGDTTHTHTADPGAPPTYDCDADGDETGVRGGCWSRLVPLPNPTHLKLQDVEDERVYALAPANTAQDLPAIARVYRASAPPIPFKSIARHPLPPLPTPTPAQRTAIDAVPQQNVQLRGPAGSGRTTVALHLADAHRGLNVLYLTPGERAFDLQDHTRRIVNLAVLSLAEAVERFYGVTGGELALDAVLAGVGDGARGERMQRAGRLERFEIVVIDGADAMTPTERRVAMKLVADMPAYGCTIPEPAVVVVGEQPWEWDGGREFTPVTLDTPLRFTKQIAEFLAEAGGPVFAAPHEAAKDGPAPRYIIDSHPLDPQTVMDEIKRLIDVEGLRPEDILVLAPSLYHYPAVILANALAAAGYPVHYPLLKSRDTHLKVRQGKIVFTSVAHAAGLEREAAIVLAFDHSSTRMGGASNPMPLATALTRAKQHLVIVQSAAEGVHPELELRPVKERCDVHGDASALQHANTLRPARGRKPTTEAPAFTVAALVGSQSPAVVRECLRQLEVVPIRAARPPGQVFRLTPPGRIDDFKHYLGYAADAPQVERFTSVASINAAVAPYILELRMRSLLPTPFWALFERVLTGDPELEYLLRPLPAVFHRRLARIIDDHGGAVPRKAPHAMNFPDVVFTTAVVLAASTGRTVTLHTLPVADSYTWFKSSHIAAMQGVLPAWVRFPAHQNWAPGTFLDHNRAFATTLPALSGAPLRISGNPDICTIVPGGGHWQKLLSLRWGELTEADILRLALHAALEPLPRRGQTPHGARPAERDRDAALLSVTTGQLVVVRPRTSDSWFRVAQLLAAAKQHPDQPAAETSAASDAPDAVLPRWWFHPTAPLEPRAPSLMPRYFHGYPPAAHDRADPDPFRDPVPRPRTDVAAALPQWTPGSSTAKWRPPGAPLARWQEGAGEVRPQARPPMGAWREGMAGVNWAPAGSAEMKMNAAREREAGELMRRAVAPAAQNPQDAARPPRITRRSDQPAEAVPQQDPPSDARPPRITRRSDQPAERERDAAPAAPKQQEPAQDAAPPPRITRRSDQPAQPEALSRAAAAVAAVVAAGVPRIVRPGWQPGETTLRFTPPALRQREDSAVWQRAHEEKPWRQGARGKSNPKKAKKMTKGEIRKWFPKEGDMDRRRHRVAREQYRGMMESLGLGDEGEGGKGEGKKE